MKKSKTVTQTESKVENNSENKVETKIVENLAFGKANYRMMLLGIFLIITGYIIMTLDKEEFGFGFMGITLGPIVCFIGFVVELFAILKKKS